MRMYVHLLLVLSLELSFVVSYFGDFRRYHQFTLVNDYAICWYLVLHRPDVVDIGVNTI